MILDPKERDVFAAYAKQEAESNAALAEQMTKIGVGPLAGMYRTKAAAWAAVAAELAKPVESVTIIGSGG